MSSTSDFHVDVSLELRIDFLNKTKPVTNGCVKKCNLQQVTFIALAFPGGENDDTEGYVIANANELLNPKQVLFLTCILSIIDLNGNSIGPSTFTKTVTGEPFLMCKFSCPSRSYVSEHADQFLDNGTLTLRCDIYLSSMTETDEVQTLLSQDRGIDKTHISELTKPVFEDFVSSVPRVIGFKNDAISNVKNLHGRNASVFRLFDFSSELLTLLRFHMPLNHLIVSGCLPTLSPHQRVCLWVEENSASIIVTFLLIKPISKIPGFRIYLPRNGFGFNAVSSKFQRYSNIEVKIDFTSLYISRTSGSRSFDFSSQTISLARYEELRRTYGFNGIFNLLSFHRFRFPYLNIETKTSHIMKYVFVVDTDLDRFLIPFQKEETDLGTQLMECSPVFKSCVTMAMKEQLEKRIDLSTIESGTLQAVLFYRQTGLIHFSNFEVFIDVYKMAHKYLDDDLLQKCAKCLKDFFKNPEEVDQIIKTADPYTDVYYLLREILENHSKENTDFNTVK